MRFPYRLTALAALMVAGGCSATSSPSSSPTAAECGTLFEQAQKGPPALVASQLEGLSAECDNLAVALHKAKTYLELAKTSTGSGQQDYAQSALSQLKAAKNKQPDQNTTLIIYGYMAEAQYYLERRASTASLLDDCDALVEQHHLLLPDWLGTFKKSFEVSLLSTPLTDEELVQLLTVKGYASRAGKINVRVPFATDQAVLTSSGSIQVEKIANIVAKSVQQGHKIMIAGHTDKRGDADHNLDLSERRAKTVRELLQRRYPAQAALFQSKGFGESSLRYDGDTPNDHELNRRVEVLLLD